MKNKIITIILTTLSISSIFAESYLLTLEDKHYKEYIVVKEVSGSQGNVSEGYGNGGRGNQVSRDVCRWRGRGPLDNINTY